MIAGIHELGYVHRDIALRNILVGLDNKVLLIDFEFCTKVQNDSNKSYCGARETASDSVLEKLQAKQDVCVQPLDDLISLSRAIHLYVTNTRVPIKDKAHWPGEVLEFWSVECRRGYIPKELKYRECAKELS